MAPSGRVGDDCRRDWKAHRHCAVAKRGGAPRAAGANTAHLPGESLVLCRGTNTGRPSSDSATLRRAGDGVWPVGSTRRPTATGEGTDDYAKAYQSRRPMRPIRKPTQSATIAVV